MPANLTAPIMGPFRIGHRNDGVRVVQERLNELARAGSPRLTADGAFGRKTDAAVRDFQKGRGLKVDGVVGPLTAKALGFTQYTSLQRLGAGAMQLASVITGSLARLVPTPHAEPDPAYDILMALAVQADAMRKVVVLVPGSGNAKREIEQLLASLQRQLESARSPSPVAGAAQGLIDAMSVLNRLGTLSRQLQALAGTHPPAPGSPERAVLDMLVLQSRMLTMQSQALMGLQAMTMQRQAEAANKVLEFAASVFRTADKLVPRF
jgi:peptidoglycan hydrolase-like protein with peptidoglycan-binding domain